MSLKVKFLNLGKKVDKDEYCFAYDEDDVKYKSWFEVIHLKFINIIAYLTYDRRWVWIDFVISLLAHAEMNLKFLFNKELQEALECCDVVVNGEHSKAELLIPKRTLYCESCPYKSVSKIAKFFYGYQMCGYCYYLGKGDFSFIHPTDLLWDGCKACGIGEEDFDIDFDEAETYN